jgi:hypothetical protein
MIDLDHVGIAGRVVRNGSDQEVAQHQMTIGAITQTERHWQLGTLQVGRRRRTDELAVDIVQAERIVVEGADETRWITHEARLGHAQERSDASVGATQQEEVKVPATSVAGVGRRQARRNQRALLVAASSEPQDVLHLGIPAKVLDHRLDLVELFATKRLASGRLGQGHAEQERSETARSETKQSNRDLGTPSEHRKSDSRGRYSTVQYSTV